MTTTFFNDNFKKLEAITEQGYTIFFDSGEVYTFSSDSIKTMNNEFWSHNTTKLQGLLSCSDFQRCGFCLSEYKGICEGIKPIIPFVEILGKHLSHEQVTLVWKNSAASSWMVLRRDLQNVLSQFALWSIVEYCTQSKRYARYYDGVKPFMDRDQIIDIILKNIYIAANCNANFVKREVQRFTKTIEITTQNKIKRINSFAKGDALQNALVIAVTPIQLLADYIDEFCERLEFRPLFTDLDEKTLRREIEAFRSDHQDISQLLRKFQGDHSKITLQSLITVIETHFSAEEKIFKKCNYTFLDFHVRSHNAILKSFYTFIQNYETHTPEEIQKFITHSISKMEEHVLELDNDYESYLIDK